jgi:hypothetical protein
MIRALQATIKFAAARDSKELFRIEKDFDIAPFF